MTVSSQSTTASAARLRTSAPAKINLTLDVLGKRPDGYHELCSLVIGIGLADELEAEIRSAPGVDLQCDDPSLNGKRNLAYRAAAAMAGACSTNQGVRLTLRKRIPVGAGLGGGSSDAAAALRLCRGLWRADVGDEQLSAMGAALGSDVPLFFSLPSAVIRGRGEQVEPVVPRWHGWVLLVFAGQLVPTAEVYAAWRSSDAENRPKGMAKAAAEATSAAALSRLLSNHLEPAIFRVAPRVGRVFSELINLGFDAVRVSGAGSALYLLYDDEEDARQAAKRVGNAIPDVITSVVPAPVGMSPLT